MPEQIGPDLTPIGRRLASNFDAAVQDVAGGLPLQPENRVLALIARSPEVSRALVNGLARFDIRVDGPARPAVRRLIHLLLFQVSSNDALSGLSQELHAACRERYGDDYRRIVVGTPSPGLPNVEE